MGITVTWDNPQRTVLRWEFKGWWSWYDFSVAQKQSNEMMVSVAHTVHAIGDMTSSRFIPPNAMIEFGRAANDVPANKGVIVLVNCSFLLETMVQTFMRINQGQGIFIMTARSIVDARDMLSQYPVRMIAV